MEGLITCIVEISVKSELLSGKEEKIHHSYSALVWLARPPPTIQHTYARQHHVIYNVHCRGCIAYALNIAKKSTGIVLKCVRCISLRNRQELCIEELCIAYVDMCCTFCARAVHKMRLRAHNSGKPVLFVYGIRIYSPHAMLRECAQRPADFVQGKYQCKRCLIFLSLLRIRFLSFFTQQPVSHLVPNTLPYTFSLSLLILPPDPTAQVNRSDRPGTLWPLLPKFDRQTLI